MNKKPQFLVGGSTQGFEKKRKAVTADELRRVMGQSAARIDPNGRNTLEPPSDPTKP